jgi:DNA repair exonuclease SbcCD ATPase subunit
MRVISLLGNHANFGSRLQIKEMRARMKELVEEVTKKDERYKQLVEVFKQLPKDNRANYTMRILEMVKNVKKQKVEINKVRSDLTY